MRSSFGALLFVVMALVVLASPGCKGRPADQYLVEAVLMIGADGAFAVASATQGDDDVDDAIISIDNTIFTYGMPVSFESESGPMVDLVIPLYYAEIPLITYGDKVNFRAKDRFAAEVYGRDNVVIPDQIALNQPVTGDVFDISDDIAIIWNDVPDTDGYVASYAEADAFNDDPAEDGVDEAEDADEDDGLFVQYVNAGDFDPNGTTEVTVPAASTIAGSALFAAQAVSGDTDIFTEDEEQNFFIVATSDEAEGAIEDQAAVAGSQGLVIAKEYSKKVEGLRFKVRESDPQQIAQAGTITIGFKMRRYKVSVAFVKAYDVNGNEYFSWIKKRIYKSKKKEYYPSFSASPGTTVVFGTHDASYRGATYSF